MQINTNNKNQVKNLDNKLTLINYFINKGITVPYLDSVLLKKARENIIELLSSGVSDNRVVRCSTDNVELREDLETSTVVDLRKYARKHNIKLKCGSQKEDIINTILFAKGIIDQEVVSISKDVDLQNLENSTAVDLRKYARKHNIKLKLGSKKKDVINTILFAKGIIDQEVVSISKDVDLQNLENSTEVDLRKYARKHNIKLKLGSKKKDVINTILFAKGIIDQEVVSISKDVDLQNLENSTEVDLLAYAKKNGIILNHTVRRKKNNIIRAIKLYFIAKNRPSDLKISDPRFPILSDTNKRINISVWSRNNYNRGVRVNVFLKSKEVVRMIKIICKKENLKPHDLINRTKEGIFVVSHIALLFATLLSDGSILPGFQSLRPTETLYYMKSTLTQN